MAQVILTAVGTAIGGPIGGAIGSALGSALDRTAINALSPARQVGTRLTGLQLNQSTQGTPVKQVFGKARVAGTIIWAARLKENRTTTRASKTAVKTERFSYSLSFAVGLCEGPIDGIGRIWADGQLLDQSAIAYRLYTGDETQTPDALIEAIEGSAPAYRGLAYMVFEDLDITAFGNRPPNLSVEVFRRPKGETADLETQITGVCLIPGAGEFVYATTPNAVLSGLTRASYETQHTGDGRSDFIVALDQLKSHLPNVSQVNLVVSWFGSSLDAASCQVRPGVESGIRVTAPLTWSVAGISRAEAYVVSQVDGRPAYGGTPSDDVVIAAIRELKARGYRVTLIPFILMDCAGFPWRGRIASGADMTPDAATVAAQFMGTADGWGLRRFVRHVADLGVAAGGVDAIILGSELRGMTTLRSAVNTYPFVAELKALAAEVRRLVGSGCQISYGADWSEYFGHQVGNHVAFHLDPLWADAHIDFVGIDWYAPLTDWRDGDHLDGSYGSIYNPDYLSGRITGGEGFDWYYASLADRDAQARTPITDGAYNEPWIYRPKDLVSWWSKAHHDRIEGVRAITATAWVPQSKPLRFIEIGCGAIDKGPNAPNLFLDPKSTESAVPPYSSGARDDAAQRACLTAYADHYATHNPVSSVYGGPMLDGMAVWCWDARPYPYFPARSDVWGDTANWRTGHWLNGRVGMGDARNLIAAIMAQAGVSADLSEVTGHIDGYVIEQPMTAAEALAPVLDYLGVSVSESGDGVRVTGAGHGVDMTLLRGDLAYHDQSPVKTVRDLITVPASLSLRCYDPDRDYQVQAVSVRNDDVAGASTVSLDVPLVLSSAQATDYAHSLLTALQTVRQAVTVAADPHVLLQLEAGDGVALDGEAGAWRVSAVDLSETPTVALEVAPVLRRIVSADPSLSGTVAGAIPLSMVTGFRLLELPCFGTDEGNVRPIVVPSADPWSGADIYAGANASSLKLRARVQQAAGVGKTLSVLTAARGDYLLRAAILDIYLEGEAPISVSEDALLGGETFICVRADNGEWEIIQYLNVTALGVDRYRLSGLVRGQWGSETARLAGASVGAEVIHLPPAFVRADMGIDELGLPRLWRTGKVGFGGVADQALDVTAAWSGLALRPRAPVFGRVTGSGDLTVTWLRRPRYGGDSWDHEPPLCEDYELYRVQVFDGGVLKRTAEVGAPEWVYSVCDQAADFPSGFTAEARVEIAQRSQVFGYGASLSVGL